MLGRTLTRDTLGNLSAVLVKYEGTLAVKQFAKHYLGQLIKHVRLEGEGNVMELLLQHIHNVRLCRHTTDNTDYKIGIPAFLFLEISKHRERLHFSVLAYCTRIDNDEIRADVGIRNGIAHFLGHSAHSFAISLILLTTEGENVCKALTPFKYLPYARGGVLGV